MVATFHMEQEARVWFQDVKETGVFSDWNSMVQALHVRFGSTPYDDPSSNCDDKWGPGH